MQGVYYIIWYYNRMAPNEKMKDYLHKTAVFLPPAVL